MAQQQDTRYYKTTANLPPNAYITANGLVCFWPYVPSLPGCENTPLPVHFANPIAAMQYIHTLYYPYAGPFPLLPPTTETPSICATASLQDNTTAHDPPLLPQPATEAPSICATASLQDETTAHNPTQTEGASETPCLARPCVSLEQDSRPVFGPACSDPHAETKTWSSLFTRDSTPPKPTKTDTGNRPKTDTGNRPKATGRQSVASPRGAGGSPSQLHGGSAVQAKQTPTAHRSKPSGRLQRKITQAMFLLSLGEDREDTPRQEHARTPEASQAPRRKSTRKRRGDKRRSDTTTIEYLDACVAENKSRAGNKTDRQRRGQEDTQKREKNTQAKGCGHPTADAQTESRDAADRDEYTQREHVGPGAVACIASEPRQHAPSIEDVTDYLFDHKKAGVMTEACMHWLLQNGKTPCIARRFVVRYKRNLAAYVLRIQHHHAEKTHLVDPEHVISDMGLRVLDRQDLSKIVMFEKYVRQIPHSKKSSIVYIELSDRKWSFIEFKMKNTP